MQIEARPVKLGPQGIIISHSLKILKLLLFFLSIADLISTLKEKEQGLHKKTNKSKIKD
jgi:hypothetical protein